MSEHRSQSKSTPPVAVIGGGIIGLSAGWRILRGGKEVILFERDLVGEGASRVAAGMLAPEAEVGFEDEAFMRLGLESLRMYPEFLEELETDSGVKVPLSERGSLMVAFTRDDTERIRRLYDFRVHLGLPVEWLLGSEAREREPLLSPRVAAAMWIPDDRQVNNRAVLDALKRAFVARGGILVEHTAVTSVDTSGGAATAVTSRDERQPVSAVVLAAGCWSNRIEGIPVESRPPVRPVKGQLLRLSMTPDFSLKHVVRAPDVYILPKDDGRLVIGASEEEMGFDTTRTAGAVFRLLERGWEAVPSIYDLALESIDVGLRPGSRDHKPIIGVSAVEDLFYATGHYRHGILLTPITAQAVADYVVDGIRNPAVADYAPERFGVVKRTG
jgi:glycine oxidase